MRLLREFGKGSDGGLAPPGDPPLERGSLSAETTTVPSAANIAEMRAVMERVGEVEGGEYDGWEASVER